MTLNQLKYFCETCRCHSITAAANQLFVTQPAISLAIRELEAEFGITLFTRFNNRLTLTEDGALFYKKADYILQYCKDMQFELIEPLNTLFKDEVRELGTQLGMPDSIVWRQPFPGPGLGIRVLGEITEDKLEIVRESDAILREEIAAAGLDRDIWQYFTVLPGIRSVGVMGDGRTYDYTVGIRAVTSIDGMTADFARIPWEVLQKISVRIVNEVAHVNRIVYDITSKPPATVEWE